MGAPPASGREQLKTPLKAQGAEQRETARPNFNMETHVLTLIRFCVREGKQARSVKWRVLCQREFPCSSLKLCCVAATSQERNITMSPIILFLRYFGKQSSTQTTGDFKNECGALTQDRAFIAEVEAQAKKEGVIPATEVIS